MRAVGLLSAFLVSSFLFVGVAGGSPGLPTKTEAVKHFRSGNSEFRLGHFDLALREYEAAWNLEPAPGLHWNLGQCHRLLGHWKEALFQFDEYRASGLATADELKLLDEELVPELKRAQEDEERKKREAAQVTSPQPIVPPPAPTLRVVHDPFYADTVGLVVAGSGIALLGVSAGFFVNASNLRDEANATPNQQEQDALDETASSRSQVAVTLSVVGGVAAVVGAIKLVINPDRIVNGTAATWKIAPTSNGVVVLGRF